MLNLPRWQNIAIIIVTALAAIFALPNVLTMIDRKSVV